MENPNLSLLLYNIRVKLHKTEVQTVFSNVSMLFSPDVDECKMVPAKCSDQTSDCVNTDGSYSCVCKNGFKKASNGTCVRK